MTSRRRGATVVFAVIAFALLSCGGYIGYRFREGLLWRAEIASVGSASAHSARLEPAWLRKRLGKYAEPLQPIVGLRLGSSAYDPATRRHREIDASPWLEQFSKISTLASLDLQSNRTVADGDIATLAASPPPELETLILSRTDIGDDALEAVARMRTLKNLSISLTLVSEDGIDRLRLARPDMRIIADPFTRRGLGRIRRSLNADATRNEIRGFSIPHDMTVDEAERIALIPNPIWIGIFTSLPDGVLAVLARQPNINSVASGVPMSADQIAAFGSTNQVKKLTLYAAQLEDDACLDAVCGIASLDELLLLGRDVEDDLPLAIGQRRPNLTVQITDPRMIGYSFDYRYRP